MRNFKTYSWKYPFLFFPSMMCYNQVNAILLSATDDILPSDISVYKLR